MYNKPVLYLGDMELPIHWILLALCCIGAALLMVLQGKKKGLKPAGVGLYAVLAAALGLFLGRAIYSAVCWYEIFLDEMGEFMGIGSFFNVFLGSVNVMGVAAGLLLAAPVTAAITKEKAASYLDGAVVPALALYALARAIEPLSGQGYGDLMGMEVCVCWIEAVITLILLAAVPSIRKRCKKPGTLAKYVLALWCLSQIMPESLRCDNVLYVFIFARVTHLGLAIFSGMTLVRLLAVWGRKGLTAKTITLDVILLAAGIGLCIATIFALDKTNLPKLLVYAVMLISLLELGYVICRRIRWADAQKEAA